MSDNRINVNGVDREMTAEEIAEKELEISNNKKIQTAEDEAKAKSATDAKEGNDKLVALGLTQDQVTAMTGYTPPSE